MKTLSRVLLIIMVLIGLTLLIGPTDAQAEVNYLGEYCFWANIPGSFGPPFFLLKVGVLSYGDGHFVLNGTGGTGDTPAYGTAVQVGDRIIASVSTSNATLTSSGFSSSEFSMIHIDIDSTSLSGAAEVLVVSQQALTSPIETAINNWLSIGIGDCP